MRCHYSNYPIAFIIGAWQLLSLVSCNTVSLFEDNVFDRLLIRQDLSTGSCITLPIQLQAAAGSIITESCLLLYIDTDCGGKSIKVDHLENNGKYDLHQVQHRPEEHFGRRVKSFKRCTSEEGGDSVNVDFYTGTNRNTPAYQYTDICECMNIPSLDANFSPLQKINNHGNCIVLYQNLNCAGQSYEIKGGLSENSENLDQLSSTFNSVSPCGNYKERCVSLSATVTRFQIISNETRIRDESTTSDVALAAKTIFRNNGSAVVSQEYSAKKEVTETLESYRAKTTSSFHNFNVAVGVKAEYTTGIPIIGQGKISASLSASYNYQKNYTESESTKFTSETKVEYAVNQKIEILPCNIYEVSSYVKVLENYPLDYVVFFEVSGIARNGTQLEAENIKQRLGSLDFVETKSNYTVIAKGFGSMVCNMGLEAVIDGEGTRIQNCDSQRSQPA